MIKAAVPDMHVHAFSALEVWQGAATLELSLDDYLSRLRDLGLGSLPGTAAEILDDEVRAIICPDKVTTDQWFEVHDAAHRVGLRSNVTMMMGHVERPVHWARHLLRSREQQARSGGFTEFVPLPFVPMEAPMFLKGRARRGPTFGEVLLVHAVARLALHPLITNVQVSWVKLGPDGVRQALAAGVNDLGGTLMNESISRAAGSEWGQELPPEQMEELIRSAGRVPRQRTTTYGTPPEAQVRASFGAEPLAEPLNPPVRESGLKAPPRLVRPGLAGATRASKRLSSSLSAAEALRLQLCKRLLEDLLGLGADDEKSTVEQERRNAAHTDRGSLPGRGFDDVEVPARGEHVSRPPRQEARPRRRGRATPPWSPISSPRPSRRP